MAYKKNSSEAFTGGSGQMVVMGELLHRKCNAAIPVIDVGTDVFAFLDHRKEVARIQVKTANGKPYKKTKGYRADFRIPIDQLERTDDPQLFYALAVRVKDGWGNILVISRANLQMLREFEVGSEIYNKKTKKSDLKLYIRFHQISDEQKAGDERKLNAVCGNIDLTEYLDAWETLPPLRPAVPIDMLGGEEFRSETG
jgi:hypothetical protein